MTSSLRKIQRSKRWMKRNKQYNAANTTNIIDTLPESLLLLEIFSRLGNPRDFLVCKTVSKRWNSLLSSSSFHNKPGLALILNTEPLCATNDMCLEGWKGFELRKYVDPALDSPVCVLASCKDVLLCTKLSSEIMYIVNPVTMQWTRLPRRSFNWDLTLPIGLIESGTKGHYHVIRLFRLESSKFIYYLFDSMLGQWSGGLVEYSPWSQSRWVPTQYQGLVFKETVHWLVQDGPVLAYNPNDQNIWLIIHRSQEMRHAFYGGDAVVSETLTFSMDHLCIIQLVQAAEHQHLSIWTLVDQSIWKQEHDHISFTDLPLLQNWTLSTQHNMSLFMHPEIRERMLSPQPLCCHLYNPLLVYFCLPESIVSLDLATKKLQLITRLIKRSIDDSVYWNQYDKVIPMTMHLDATLVADHGQVLRRYRKRRRSFS